MRKIRKGVFETNSSSTHSICITKNMLLNDLRTHLDFRMQDFGWECEEYHDAETKANYLYTALCNTEEHELILALKDTLNKNEITCTFEDPEDKTWGGYKAYIDHYSDLKNEFRNICLDEESLMRYLFSKQSFIITGNDNDDTDVSIHVSYDYDEIYKGN